LSTTAANDLLDAISYRSDVGGFLDIAAVAGAAAT
jgi:hypothetical protein